jgi:hypothetical protein
MKKASSAIVTGLVILFASVSLATCESKEDNGDNKYAVEDLAWLVGHWRGEGFGGMCEEIWNPVSGGTMVGTFKLFTEGQVQFYEIMTILPDSAGPKLVLKHFNADLTGWEEKDSVVTFHFVDGDSARVQFGGLIYERISPTELHITVGFSHADGTTSQEVIRCRKLEP